MFAQYFGHFLLNSGYITLEQLQYALDYEKNTRVKIGILALNASYMTPEQIEFVRSIQLKEDKKFGQIAIENGFLTQDQLNQLLKTQKKGHYVLSQCLIEKGYLSLTGLQDAMTKYAQKYHLNANVLDEIEEDKTIKNFFNFKTTLWKKIYSEYVSLLIRNCNRFIGEIPVISIKKMDAPLQFDWSVSQEIKGKFYMFTSLSSNDESSLIKLAELYCKEKYSSFNEYSKDAASKFLNLHNSIFLVNMSNMGVQLDMYPHQIKTTHVIQDNLEVFKVTLSWIWGTIDMIIY